MTLATCLRRYRNVPPEALAAVARRTRVRLDAMRQPGPLSVASSVRELDAALGCLAGLCAPRTS